MSRRTLLQGIAMGTAYGIAQLFLMFGIVHTSASVSGFLTGMYAVFTAVMVALILRRNPPPRVWISVGLATAALGVLTLAPGATGGLAWASCCPSPQPLALPRTSCSPTCSSTNGG